MVKLINCLVLTPGTQLQLHLNKRPFVNITYFHPLLIVLSKTLGYLAIMSLTTLKWPPILFFSPIWSKFAKKPGAPFLQIPDPPLRLTKIVHFLNYVIFLSRPIHFIELKFAETVQASVKK